MYSYKEFPEQVAAEMKIFAEENNFELIAKEEDHCVRYRNRTWELSFFCDHGAVELSFINLDDGYKYSLYDILELWFPESTHAKESTENVWGSLKTVKFNVDALKNYYKKIDKTYISNKASLDNCKRRSSILINFALNQGSRRLQNEFTWSSDNWIELASYEYANNGHSSLWQRVKTKFNL
ncbi:hypothetical protein [uncultured Kordia sp.]|uniref:hypothetical protein n=1 Tax=uncultured Kordia sp. TaxID=507699 RepID=UPI00260BA81F|nr:hypothetical protein [uncultured Kordia sp.]